MVSYFSDNNDFVTKSAWQKLALILTSMISIELIGFVKSFQCVFLRFYKIIKLDLQKISNFIICSP